MGRFVIRPVPTGMKFDLRAANGEIIAVSEVYSSAAACQRGMESVRKCAACGKVEDLTGESQQSLTNPKFTLYRDKRGQFRFRLHSRNGKILIFSEGYTTKAACLKGIESVAENSLP